MSTDLLAPDGAALEDVRGATTLPLGSLPLGSVFRWLAKSEGLVTTIADFTVLEHYRSTASMPLPKLAPSTRPSDISPVTAPEAAIAESGPSAIVTPLRVLIAGLTVSDLQSPALLEAYDMLAGWLLAQEEATNVN